MKIVVCIKQVPDTKGGVQFNPDGTLNRAAMLAIMNPDDKAGLEAALRLKDQYGAEVTVLTMGLPKADEVLREAMAMGADKGILVTDRVLGGADTWATSTTIAGALRNIDYDLIITGRQAIDGDTAQVGPQIAEKLHVPQVSYVEEIKEAAEDYVVVRRQFEDGYHIIKIKTPCLLTAIAELATPRYMTVRGIVEAYEKEIKVLDFEALKDDLELDMIGLKGSPTNVYQSFTKEVKGAGTILKDLSADEAVKAIVGKLEEKFII